MAAITKSDVKKARDALISQGRHPSIDAVRVELDNKGSKTTISKYLRELDSEDGGPRGRRAHVGEALQDLVSRLAAGLYDEADERVNVLRAEYEASAAANAARLAAVQQDNAQKAAQLQDLQQQLASVEATLAQTGAALARETTERMVAQQHARDLKDQLAENERHRASLEEKHRHSREALEHYRATVRDQREADAQRHEQQVQQLQGELRTANQLQIGKQEEVTRLNAEAARLAAERDHLKDALARTEATVREHLQEITGLRTVAAKHDVLVIQVRERDEHAKELVDQLESSRARAMEAQLGNAAVQRELAVVTKELERVRAVADGLALEKQNWTRERVELEQQVTRSRRDG